MESAEEDAVGFFGDLVTAGVQIAPVGEGQGFRTSETGEVGASDDRKQLLQPRVQGHGVERNVLDGQAVGGDAERAVRGVDHRGLDHGARQQVRRLSNGFGIRVGESVPGFGMEQVDPGVRDVEMNGGSFDVPFRPPVSRGFRVAEGFRKRLGRNVREMEGGGRHVSE